MSTRWEAVRAELLRSISTLHAEQEFTRNQGPVLARFAGPSALVAYLNDPGGDLDEKDRIYALLVEAVQRRVAWVGLAMALLWLGLWPALDHVYRRRLHRFLPEIDDLIEAISVSFVTAIGHAGKLNRVAATLAMNTSRDVTEAIRKKDADRLALRTLPEDDRLAAQREVEPAYHACGGTEPQEMGGLRARLAPIVGRDVDLVLAVVLGESQREAGSRLGLSHDVARKRYQRALDRIRSADDVVVPFPPSRVRL